MPRNRSSPSRVSRWLDLLSAGGCRPRIVSDQDAPTIVCFEWERERYLLFVEARDPQFFHLASAYELGPTDLSAAVGRANELNEELKVVKLTVWEPDRSVRIHVEGFVEAGLVSLAVLDRCVGAIRHAARKFFQRARALERLDA